MSRQFLSIMLVCVWVGSLLAAEPAADLAALRASYEKSLAGIQTSAGMAVRNWPVDYTNALVALQVKMQKEGNLEGWTAIRDEISRFQANPKIGNDNPVGAPPELQIVQAKYRDLPRQASLEKSKKILSLTKKYLSALTSNQTDLTKEGNIEKALAFNAEIKRVKASPEVTAAEFEVSDQEGKTAPGEPGKAGAGNGAGATGLPPSFQPTALNRLEGREKALAKYGGARAVEGTVLKALRWLKSEQAADGSWSSPPVAMTAFALLCYLGHGETPSSEEFGPTVEKAIKYLSTTPWPSSYPWPIATYAMCEAYGMTGIPALKDVAYKGVDGVIRGQNANGGWGYGIPTVKDDYNDTCLMGWCAQALKAAKLAGIEHPELEKAIKMTIQGFKRNANPNGGFGYRSGDTVTGLTGAGVLCMQLLGAAREAEVKKGLIWLDQVDFRWNDAWGNAPLYYWYYITQAKFHAGGLIWSKWNRQFSEELTRNQTVLKATRPDEKDTGYWESPKKDGNSVAGHGTGLVFNTCFCTLMLETFYRYLPGGARP